MEDQHLSKKKLVEQEYEVQHFGFSSQTMNDVVRGVIKEAVSSAADSLARKMAEHMKECKPEDIRAAADSLVKQYEDAMEESLSMWKDTLEKHFQIPSYVLLEEDELQRQRFSSAEAEAVDSELASLECRAKRAALMEIFLDTQLEAVRQTKRQLDECEARVKDDQVQASIALCHKSRELADNAQAFLCGTSSLWPMELRRKLRNEATGVLTPRFQHLK